MSFLTNIYSIHVKYILYKIFYIIYYRTFVRISILYLSQHYIGRHTHQLGVGSYDIWVY